METDDEQRDMQEALVREAIVEMDKHRLSLDRDRVALALQLNILTQEVRPPLVSHFDLTDGRSA